MNSTELAKKFFDFEKKNKLFDLQTQDGIYWWDIVRYHIYLELMTQIIRENQQAPINNQYKKINKIIILLMKDFLYLVQSLFKNNNYFFFLYPRNMDKKGFAVDYISNDTFKLLHKDSFIVDVLKTNLMQEKVYTDTLLLFIRKLFVWRKKKYNIGIEGIDELFNKEFGVRLDFENKINIHISTFKADILYYRSIFSLFKPKIVFLTANGQEKGMLYVCQQKEIKAFELQHGQISDFHPYYSYPKDLNLSRVKTLPYGFLSFSSYWHKINYPVKVKLNIGSSNYNLSMNRTGNNVLIVTHNIYMENLLPLIKELALNIKDKKIILKLHPEQRNEVEDIKVGLEEFNNIEIVCNEKSIIYVFQECSSMITIQSTTVYEALQSGIKVFLYKKQDYDSHIDLFNSKNLYLVENAQQILDGIDRSFIEEKMVFFEKFDGRKFLNFIHGLT